MAAKARSNLSTVTIALAMGLGVVPLGLAGADSVRLQPGLYEVEVRLDLPYLENTTPKQLKIVCLTSAAIDGIHGLAVLSENNPLANCPISNAHHLNERFTFDILCGGSNMGSGTATYILGSDRFTGRIAMKMGGKNMTMTEVQRGRRVGDCRGTSG